MTKKYFIYILVISTLIISIVIILINVSRRSYYISLVGENPIILYEGSEYKEPGYIAHDSYGQNVSNKVKVESNLNTSREGVYQIKYIVESKTEISRSVIVKEMIPDDLEVDFKLKGSNVIDLKLGNAYHDSGVQAFGNNSKDYSRYIEVIGRVDERKVGTYQIEYHLKVGKVDKTLIRTINVTGEKYTVSLSDDTLTNKNVIISVQSNLKDFSHFINPINAKIENEKIDYVVSFNGKYTFYMYDNKGNNEKIEVNVENIDKNPPSGTCTAYVIGEKTRYELSAEDLNGIDRFVYNNKSFKESSFEVINTSETDVVTIYDKASNIAKVICEYPEIKSRGKIIANYRSDTLKYWIEKPSNYYTVTHIWVKDAYNQLKTAINNEIGTLETASIILNREIKNNDYSKKGMIAINASGFVMSHSNNLIKYNKDWLYSSSAPFVIYNGTLVRNFANHELPSSIYPVFGLKDNGYLTYVELGGGNAEIENNAKKIESALNLGIKYSFSFNPILVINNKVNSNLTSKNIRQGLCQIDRNNFVIITNTNSTAKRTVGLSFKELAEYMVSLNCKTGFNLDGGGSVNLFYKSNYSTVKSIRTSGRKIADILYFVE